MRVTACSPDTHDHELPIQADEANTPARVHFTVKANGTVVM